MFNYKFTDLKEKVLEYIDEYKINTNDVLVDIAKNEGSILIIDFSFKHCLAQMTVNEPKFAPYNMISFESITGESNKANNHNKGYEMIYFFYDTKENTLEEVIIELDKAIKYCENYKPDELNKKYIGKVGYLNISNDMIKKLVHPDDIDVLNLGNLLENFVCIDVEFQYLKIKGKEIVIRILPLGFKVIA